jgi:hypothetical protein
MILGYHYTTLLPETARSVASTSNGPAKRASVVVQHTEQEDFRKMPISYFQTVVVSSCRKSLCQEGTIRLVTMQLAVRTEFGHTPGGVNPPKPTSPPPSADASSSQTHNPSSPAVQTEFHSPSSRIAPAPNKKQTNAERESTLETLEGSLLLLALLWPFFSCRAGGGRLHASGFPDICDTCVLTGNRARGEENQFESAVPPCYCYQ